MILPSDNVKASQLHTWGKDKKHSRMTHKQRIHFFQHFADIYYQPGINTWHFTKCDAWKQSISCFIADSETP
jgi:hypothetical protein